MVWEVLWVIVERQLWWVVSMMGKVHLLMKYYQAGAHM